MSTESDIEAMIRVMSDVTYVGGYQITLPALRLADLGPLRCDVVLEVRQGVATITVPRRTVATVPEFGEITCREPAK